MIQEKSITEERRVTKSTTLSTLVDVGLTIEKLRVSVEVRQSHLARQGKHDPETAELHRRLKDFEDFVDGRVSDLIQNHPAYGWFSKVKGVGKENIAKVVANIDIALDDTPSSLWKFAGFSVENGAAPKRVRGGGKLQYNSQLRSLCWRLGSSLLRAGGKFYDYYLKEKDKYYQKYENQGVTIVPAASLPKKDGKRYEPEGVMSGGHIHNMALRKMIKLFLACLWVVWREAEGLPITKPYAIDRLGHNSYINPWETVENEPKVGRKLYLSERASRCEETSEGERFCMIETFPEEYKGL